MYKQFSSLSAQPFSFICTFVWSAQHRYCTVTCEEKSHISFDCNFFFNVHNYINFSENLAWYCPIYRLTLSSTFNLGPMHTEKYIWMYSFLLQEDIPFGIDACFFFPTARNSLWRNTHKGICYSLHHHQLQLISCSDSLFQFSRSLK